MWTGQPIPRHLEPIARERMQETPVLLLEGPRSVGKSTLLRTLASSTQSVVADLDDPATSASVAANPSLYASGPPPVCIDEFQKAPVILDAIKAQLNTATFPGRYLLAGSTRFDSLPTAAQALTGRLHRIPVMPLTQAEIELTDSLLLAGAFEGDVDHALMSETSRSEYVQRILTGGFPLALAQRSEAARSRWFNDQLTLTLERDARDTRGFANAESIRSLLTRLGGQSGQLLNVNNLASGLGVSANTTSSYIKLLEAVFLVSRLPAWGRTATSRALASPKIHVVDSGLGGHLLRLSERKLATRTPAVLTEFGHLLESFVVQELLRHASWLDTPVAAGHWRTRDGDEVDLILERFDGTVVAVEVKAADAITPRDSSGLRNLKRRLGDMMSAGLLFYLGTRSWPVEPGIHVLPVDRLWRNP